AARAAGRLAHGPRRVLGAGALAVAQAALRAALGQILAADAVRIGAAAVHRVALAHLADLVARHAGARAGQVATDTVDTESGGAVGGTGARLAEREIARGGGGAAGGRIGADRGPVVRGVIAGSGVAGGGVVLGGAAHRQSERQRYDQATRTKPSPHE